MRVTSPRRGSYRRRDWLGGPPGASAGTALCDGAIGLARAKESARSRRPVFPARSPRTLARYRPRALRRRPASGRRGYRSAQPLGRNSGQPLRACPRLVDARPCAALRGRGDPDQPTVLHRTPSPRTRCARPSRGGSERNWRTPGCCAVVLNLTCCVSHRRLGPLKQPDAPKAVQPAGRVCVPVAFERVSRRGRASLENR